ncbi:hypothetical protein HYDPIDRAFT_108359 [Hydnomerulius pinastri MD-312]|nr:hypothetical protein HYDPIDRAFT_108359 [Hydnomerulius pinastri MD-312]
MPDVVFAGETGVGKSFLINLLAQQQLAKTSNDVCRTTGTNQSYGVVTLGGKEFRLWETPGWNEGHQDKTPSPAAKSKVYTDLFGSIGATEGILLVFCFRAPNTTLDLDIYKAIKTRPPSAVPVDIVAVVTGLASTPGTNDWWRKKEEYFASHDVVFPDQIYVPTLPANSPSSEQLRLSSYGELSRLIISNSCWKGQNVLVVGETGSGRSSVINLICGQDVAQVSASLSSCTTYSKCYPCTLDNANFRIYDTVGFNATHGEAQPGKQGTNGQTKAPTLGRGRIDLVLFCMRGDQISTALGEHYRLAALRATGNIAIVVTHLEAEPRMNDWPSKHSKVLESLYSQRRAIGLTCVTTLRQEGDKWHESRSSILKLLQECSGTLGN